MKSTYLKLLVYFICAICIYDIYCTVNLHETIYEDEANPIAKALITQEEVRVYYGTEENKIKIVKYISIIKTDVSKLILFKVTGLIAALEIFDWLINSKHSKITEAVIFAIVIMQFSLLLYLTLV